MRLGAVLICACLFTGSTPIQGDRSAQTQDLSTVARRAEVDGVTRLIAAIQYAIEIGDAEGLRALARPAVVSHARLADFVQSMTSPKAAQVTIKERDRAPLEGGGQRLLLEILTVRDTEGRVSTWRLDALPGGADEPWAIVDVERLTVINGLFRLSLDPAQEWDVHDAVVNAPDLTLTVASGYAFAAHVPDGTTAIVFIGRGRAEFAPKSDAERGQVRLFAGADALKADFDSLFLRMNPDEFKYRVSLGALKPRPVDQGHLRRATQTFDLLVAKSYLIDLNDLSAVRWSLVPSYGDFVAEIATSRYGGLTYARATGEPEDISVFDRRRKRNISIYTSEAKASTRGRFFSEDERLDYDVTLYDIDLSFSPERLWLDGTARLSLHTRSALATITLRLADPLVVRGVTSPELGRMLHLRVVGQNSVLIGFPGTIPGNTDIDLVVTYGGRLPAQSIEREAIALNQDPQQDAPRREQDVAIPAEPQWAYSNRSYWYPQGTVTDYARAKVAITVPSEFDVIASGTPQGPPSPVAPSAGQRPRKRFTFETARPVRYLAYIVSRFQSAPPVALKVSDDSEPLTLRLEANPRLSNRMRSFTEKASDILKFYGSLMADAPYGSFTLALTESDLPGGHSPAYFAMLNQPLPTSPYAWGNDPVSFPNYPSFFIAHEIAHQWWGQAVGWKNYHEQWISEGFAQYLAALYAEKEKGPEQFTNVIRQMRRWAIEMSPQGPVYLGYRLGHIRSEGRVFRALVYNKGAMVLHMLRRLVGDDAFFGGLRDFYSTWRFKKAGTDDFRVAMEKAAGGRSLERFFDRWIYDSGVPTVRFTTVTEGSVLTLRFDQKGELYDIPITVTVTYADGTTEDVVVPVTDRMVERRIELKQAVKTVEANRDGAAVVQIER